MASESASTVKMSGVERMRWGREASSGKGGRGPVGVERFDEPATKCLCWLCELSAVLGGRRRRREGGMMNDVQRVGEQ